ncbi:MAG: AzlD domain-containing protein [Ilumatobacteraceae bacterium]
MTDVWLAIAIGAVIAFVLKAAGPALLGGRELPRLARRFVTVLPSAVLAAIVVVQTFADGKSLTFDARAAGFAVAGLALWRRAPLLIVLVLAAGTTALVRLVS